MTEKKDFETEIIDAIFDKKGKNITIINLSSLETAPAGKFVICQGNNTTQVTAIADSIRHKLLEEKNIKPYNYTGYNNAQWIVLDYGETFIHIFLPETREYYNLEELWNDAPAINVPNLD